ncbi:MAG: hypothetical protein IT450_16585 [Phycisphaerales bacterium]|nr:hypothetical protein [Phycisphaerales bacterium]
MSSSHSQRIGVAVLVGAIGGPVVMFLALGFDCFGAIAGAAIPVIAGNYLSRGEARSGWRQLYALLFGIAGGGSCVLIWQLTLDPKDSLAGLSGALALGYSLIAGFGLWVFAVIGTFLPRGRVPSAANSCSSCGYDLTGNVSGRCPECGRLVSARDGLAGK